MRDQVTAQLRRILVEDFRVASSLIREDARLTTDLRIDSVLLVDLYYVVQKDFRLKVDLDAFQDQDTVAKLTDFVVANLPTAR